MLFAVKCPYTYCQHENKPGARFCADCGAPLHLKPCAKCGKIDDVTVKTCAGCGTAFPTIELAEYGSSTNIDPQNTPASTPKATQHPTAKPEPNEHSNAPKNHNKAVPLIIVALVAGGLPLLWMFRDQLPKPRGIEIQSPSNVTPHNVSPNQLVAPTPAPAIQTSPAPIPPPAAVPMPTPTTLAPPATVTPPPVTEPTVPVVAPPPQPPASKRENTVKKTVQRTEAPTKPAPPKTKIAPPAEEPVVRQPTHPCTAAVAALGLCDPE